ncbi:chorismate transformation enzyme, FkbO/Hyg5 family [Bombella apis]|uniref:chorismate transformation enzyme, FkbO/Hyg5 family n=1 Tax=Bombella apis TaxID=1785988 RepID=UPI0012B818F1|nr:hypothetical protein [Bombella apis]MPV99084.1 hypothetical protein [Bombella apis]
MMVLLPVYHSEPERVGPSPLATICYGGASGGLDVRNGRVHMTLPGPLPATCEQWCPASLSGETRHEQAARGRQAGLEQGIGWSAEGDLLFAAFWVEDQPELCEAVQTSYERLIGLARGKGFGHIYRMWNYLGAINQDNARGEERYRDFCSGRSQAFEAMSIGLGELPAATGIGLSSGGVAVFLIAHRHVGGVNLENPSQLPAYHYPPRYGRRSPSFARATVMEGPDRTALYLSGTASIRGHESVGTTVEEQLSVTIETINSLLDAARKRFPRLEAGRFESMKLYVRHPEDAAVVREGISRAFQCPLEQSPLFIADICRAELLLEVEGVFLG